MIGQAPWVQISNVKTEHWRVTMAAGGVMQDTLEVIKDPHSWSELVEKLEDQFCTPAKYTKSYKKPAKIVGESPNLPLQSQLHEFYRRMSNFLACFMQQELQVRLVELWLWACAVPDTLLIYTMYCKAPCEAEDAR